MKRQDIKWQYSKRQGINRQAVRCRTVIDRTIVWQDSKRQDSKRQDSKRQDSKRQDSKTKPVRKRTKRGVTFCLLFCLDYLFEYLYFPKSGLELAPSMVKDVFVIMYIYTLYCTCAIYSQCRTWPERVKKNFLVREKQRNLFVTTIACSITSDLWAVFKIYEKIS